MATYYFDIPVIVTRYDEEGEERLEATPELIARIVDDFNEGDLKQYCRAVKIADMYALLLDSIALGRIRVRANVPGAFSRQVAEKIRSFLRGQCSDGWGENGFDIDRHTIANVWDREHDVEIVGLT